MALWNQMMFQDSNSPIMESMIMFHDHGMLIIIMIISMILYIIMFMFINTLINRFMLEGQMIEIIWTVIPIFFLVFLAIPSLKILYMTDELNIPNLTMKVIGHQWYWSYEYSDFTMITFDSFMLKSMNMNDFRLLDVDNRMILPFGLQLRLLITSEDVIHSFAVPTMGIKVDAVPGRINQTILHLIRPGVFFGQCSEICGVNHSFMPIVLESTTILNFMQWIHDF
ncbi:cytochrome oxidase subunit 2 (mitochondrion) [Muscidifurax raptorellus]|nr:cytochrome c oxidase subunit II [Muscidifurax raptorellus]UAT98637.1 cytochrome oxidase subunit 2 [Muscidifurax raptorellus]